MKLSMPVLRASADAPMLLAVIPMGASDKSCTGAQRKHVTRRLLRQRYSFAYGGALRMKLSMPVLRASADAPMLLAVIPMGAPDKSCTRAQSKHGR